MCMKLNPAAVIVIALLSLTLAAPTANAGSDRCQSAGLRLVTKSGSFELLQRHQRGKRWEQGPMLGYGCSLRYGRRVKLGVSGLSPDGPIVGKNVTGNSRYVAWVNGYGGNAGNLMETSLKVRDLKTGKQVLSVLPGSEELDQGTATTALVLTPGGGVGWITSSELAAGSIQSVWKSIGAHGKQLLASGQQIDPYFLRFDFSSRKLVWVTATDLAP
jgi:hypothetical protein